MATITVDSAADDGSGGLTLREALTQAASTPGADVIEFDAALDGATITLADALTIGDADGVTINGDIDRDGSSDITLSGGGTERFFVFTSGAQASVNDLTLTNGFHESTFFETAALIAVENGATVAFDGLTIGNSTTQGRDGDITSNLAGGDATTILVSVGGTLSLRNASIQFSVDAKGGDGADGSGSFFRPATEGGDGVVGIINAGTVHIEDVGFNGRATGGRGGDAGTFVNGNGADGGDAFVGIVNTGTLNGLGGSDVSGFGVNRFPSLFAGVGGQGDGAGSDGTAGTTGTGIRNDGGTVDPNLVTGSSLSQFANIVSFRLSNAPQVVFGLGGNDTLSGRGGGDSIFGGAGDDDLQITGTGANLLSGGDGNDILRVDTTGTSLFLDVTVNGNAGQDELSINNMVDDIVIDLALDTFQVINPIGFVPIGLTIKEVENVTTLLGNDTILGSAADNAIFTQDGADSINGRDGNDTLDGGAGNDTLSGGDNNDSLIGGTGLDDLRGGSGNDTLEGGDRADTLLGGTGEDSLSGGNGNDSLKGEADNDTLLGDAGNDTLVGGNGQDDLNGGTNNDSLKGDAGNDTLSGEAGKDTLIGGDDDDVLIGGTGRDSLRGGNQDDLLNGNAGNDTLRGDSGDDTLNGGDKADLLVGGSGRDRLNGGSGKDTIEGGSDRDVMTGGASADTFVFNAPGDSAVGGANRDVITDFDSNDVIDLSGIDAQTGGGGNQAFTFIDQDAFSGMKGELRYKQSGTNTIVQGDRNGDGVADFEIQLNGPLTLDAGDFIL